MSSFPDPFRDQPNYEESLQWVGLRNRKGKQIWITLEDYQRIIADSQAREEARRARQKPAAKGRAKGQRS